MQRKVYKKKKKRVRKSSHRTKNAQTHSPWWIFVLWIIFMGSVVYTVFFTTVMHITEINIAGVERADQDKMMDIFREESTGTNWLSLTKKHFFLFDAAEYRERLLQIPEVRAVVVRKVFPNRLVVTVEEYDTILIVCTHGTAPQQCIIIDTLTGMVAMRQTDFPPERLTRNKTVRIVLQQDVFDEHFFLDQTAVENILLFAQNISYYADVHIVGDYYAQTIGLRDFFLMTDDGWELRVDFTQDIERVLERLRRLFDHTDLGVQRSDIAYIDMRFGERIFYKMRNAENREAHTDFDDVVDVGDTTDSKD